MFMNLKLARKHTHAHTHTHTHIYNFKSETMESEPGWIKFNFLNYFFQVLN